MLCICGEEGTTKDHIIPISIYKRFPLAQIGIKKNLGKSNIQWLCRKCNSQKANKIDTRHPIGRMFWIAVRDAINKELNEPIW